MPPQPQPQNSLTLSERIAIIEWLATFPALTVLVLLRNDCGYRLLSPRALIGTATFMVLLAMLFHQTNGWELLVAYAAMMLYYGLRMRAKRWREIQAGIKHHTYAIGSTEMKFLSRLPAIFRRQRRTERFVEPLLVILCGFGFLPFVRSLGLWLILSGMCLRIVEAAVYKRELNQALDMVDGLIISNRQGETIENFTNPLEKNADSPAKPSAIPTGVGEDIKAKIKRRKNKPSQNSHA